MCQWFHCCGTYKKKRKYKKKVCVYKRSLTYRQKCMPSLLLLLLQIVSKLALSIVLVIRWRPLIKNSPLSISSPRGKENITVLLVLRIKCNLNRARSCTKYMMEFFERRVTPHKIRQSHYWQHILTFSVSWSQKRQKVPSTELKPFTQHLYTKRLDLLHKNA